MVNYLRPHNVWVAQNSRIRLILDANFMRIYFFLDTKIFNYSMNRMWWNFKLEIHMNSLEVSSLAVYTVTKG